MKKYLALFFISLTIFLSLPSFYLIAQSQSIELREPSVVYNLPYPGLLPDHPLYVFKKTRDNILVFATRDTMKKAQLYLLLSDKHIAMAVELENKGKDQQAFEQLQEAEALFVQIPPLLETSKEQGVSPTGDFMQTLFLSNAKHQQVITQVIKNITDPQVDDVNALIKLNSSAKTSLNKI